MLPGYSATIKNSDVYAKWVGYNKTDALIRGVLLGYIMHASPALTEDMMSHGHSIQASPCEYARGQ